MAEFPAQSCKSVVQLLFHSCCGNIGTNTGQNLKYLKDKHNIVSLKTLISEKNKIKKLKLYTLPSEESWKLNIIEEISLVKKSLVEVDFDEKDLDEILFFICTD